MAKRRASSVSWGLKMIRNPSPSTESCAREPILPAVISIILQASRNFCAKIISPIRERIQEIDADNDYLKKVADNAADKARYNAIKTIKEVRKIMGFRSF